MAEEDKKPQDISGEQRFAGPGFFPGVPGGVAVAPRKTWPELVGLTGEEAEAKVKEEKPEATVHVLPHDSFVTMDYRLDRVRIFTDSDGKVTRAPTVG